MSTSEKLKACHCCGLIQWVPALERRGRVRCARCGTRFATVLDRASALHRTAGFALAGLLFYFPALFLPILEIERFGQSHRSSVLEGCWSLLSQGEWFVGGIILVFSVILPPVKLLLLLALCGRGLMSQRHKAWTYRMMERIGRWGMLDVLLVALLVALVKLGGLVRFHLGPAALAFGLCILASMLAGAFFDPHSVWEEPA